MCWVQRKTDIPGLKDDAPTNPFHRQVSDRIAEFDALAKEAENELVLVNKALGARKEALAALGGGEEKEKGQDESESEYEYEEEEEEEGKEEEEEEEDDGDYLKSSERYMAKRPEEEEFKKQITASDEALKDAMKAGINAYTIVKAKKGAFGRTKKASRQKCFVMLSSDSTKLSWGKDSKRLKDSLQLGSVDSVLTGYQSPTFQEMNSRAAGKEPEWACFTLESMGKQYDFVVEQDLANLYFATMIKQGKQPSPAQWRWRRTMMRFQEQGGMLGAINQVARGSVASSVSGSDVEASDEGEE